MDKFKENSRYFISAGVVIVIMLVYVLRLVDWQLINGAEFRSLADKTRSPIVTMDAARGEILDVNGVGLAVNKTGYAIVFEKAYMDTKNENKTIYQMISLLNSLNEKWTDELPIKINNKGSYEFIKDKEKDIKKLKSKDFLNMNEYATADDCMAELIKKYKINGYPKKETRDIVSVRYNMEKNWFGVSNPYIFAPDVKKDTVAIVSENSPILPGVTVKVTTMRENPDGTVIPHVMGTVGAISKEEYDVLEVKEEKGYALNDTLGKSGIEKKYEDTLRGKSGEKVVEINNKGSLVSEAIKSPPKNGNTVFLTIDSRIQKVLNKSLADNVNGAQAYGRSVSAVRGPKHGEDCVAGGAVVLNVKDFSVLAASTYPSYDLNKYKNDKNYYSTLINDKAKPLINRAFNGIFTPGSSFKPAVAMAALQENSITNSTVIDCTHVYERFAPSFTPKCMGHHGPISLNTALAKSCNIFFFETGFRTGIENMNLYCKRLGLGVKTGLEIDESAGKLAGPQQRTSMGGTWQGGDTIQAAIGQSDNQFSPLQLATYCATIANNGTRLQTHIVNKITDYSQKNIVSKTAPKVADNAGVSQKNIDYVKSGMRSVATSGTASSMFRNYGIAIAGKTGTAEGPGSDNVTFIGFAPYENPEIAVAVVLEHGATSRFSNTVAKDIFDAYFYGKSVDDKGNFVFPTPASSAGSAVSGASSASH
jgi:penicillin-binding protein 2